MATKIYKAKKRTVRVYGIEWDTDGEKVEGLPAEVVFETAEDYPTIAENLADCLSDKYGFCVNDVKFAFVDETNAARMSA